MAESVAKTQVGGAVIPGPMPGIESEWVFVTPAMAAQWLQHDNTLNRTMRVLPVDQMARDQAEGRWQVTHQGIGFDVDKVLVDGQHRLLSIVHSGKGQWLLVTRGLDPTVRAVVDAHSKRAMNDRMALVGFDWVSQRTVAIVRRMLASFTPTRAAQLRASEVQTALRVHGEAVRFAEACFGSVVRGVTIAAVEAVVARAFYSVEPVRLRTFGQVMVSGFATEKADEPAILLRNNLLASPSGARGSVTVMATYAKTERALLAFVKGEELGRLYEARSEQFLLPEEKAAKTEQRRRRR